MGVTLQSRFPEIIAEMRPKLTKALKSGCQDIADEASARCPRSDGPGHGYGMHEGEHLADHIDVIRHGTGAYDVGFSEDFFYGKFLEYGSAHQSAQPFLIPAAEAKKGDVALKLTAVLWEL